MNIETQFEFTLPVGYIDSSGNVHKKGIMRLATAADEIIPVKDARTKNNSSYLAIILISRVILRLGDVENITTDIVENLFTKDFSYLQDMYNRVNEHGDNIVHARCPKCDSKFDVEVPSMGES